uniref:Acetylglutamate kinase n=1 Tax=Pterothamnion crispum TaxID=1550583 RepID=A0A4D6WXX9_9FLOR|nr:acetylglutamate kinase [Pterothamnion crispum]
MVHDIDFIKVFNEASPLIQHLSGRIIVIKYGGAAMKDNSLKLQVIEDIVFLYNLGIKIILVHGGGPMINSWLNKLNITPKFQNGIRITDHNTMPIVEMVLVGQVNKELVSLLNQKNIPAIGLSGKDANLILSSKYFSGSDNLVGKVDMINNQILTLLLDSGYIPVLASVAADKFGETHNINADTVAGAIAESLECEKLVLLTDTSGIMIDISDISTLQKFLNISEVQNLIEQNVISGGMIPKVECCIKALKNNVNATHIINGSIEHALLIELLTINRSGSQIVL